MYMYCRCSKFVTIKNKYFSEQWKVRWEVSLNVILNLKYGLTGYTPRLIHVASLYMYVWMDHYCKLSDRLLWQNHQT